MAFYDVVILHEDAYEESKSGKDRGTFTIKRTLLAKSNTPNPSFVAIGTSTAGWPGLGGEAIDQLNGLRNFDGIIARCSSRNFSWFEGTESGVKIELTYEGLSPYENTESGGSEQPRELETVTWRRISLSTSQVSVPATDEEGRSFTNSAGDPVDGLEEETALAVLKYTNEFNPDPALSKIWDWLNTCNSVPYLGAAPYTLRVTGFSADFDDKSMLWKTALEITYNPKTWTLNYYDAGTHEIVSDGGDPPVYTRKVILDEPGNPVSNPVLLNGQGGQAPIEQPEEIVNAIGDGPGAGNFFVLKEEAKRSARPYPEKDFNLMLSDLRMY
tara:strand:- start:153 stop:1136 length:984 start_codon:yes stop_codon:yes gene_type:complete